MKSIYKIMSLLIAAIVGLSACSNESLLESREAPQGNSITFTIEGADAPLTRATPAANPTNPTVVQTPALAREKAISSVWAVIFKDKKWYKTVQATGTGTYTVPVDLAGTFELNLVANPNPALVAKLKAVKNRSEFQNIIVDQVPGEDQTATNFLMTSAEKQVTTTAGKTTNIGAIKMVRVAARFDLYNRVEKLNITKVTFKNRYTQSRLERGASNLSMLNLAFNSKKSYSAAQGLTKYQLIGAMYAYENVVPAGTSLVIEGDYAGQALRPTEIVLENTPIKRNHLYSIILSERNDTGADDKFNPENAFGKLKFDVVVKDWEEGETIEWTGVRGEFEKVPEFSAQGANLTEANAKNPSTLTVTNPAQNKITLTVKGLAGGSTLVHTEGSLPTGYVVTSNDVKIVAGEPTQTIEISLPQNNTYDKELHFRLRNSLNPSAIRTFTLKHKGVRPKLPIDYVTDVNIDVNGVSFVQARNANNNSNAGGYFTYAAGVSKFSNIMIDWKRYHLPSAAEWLAVTSNISLDDNNAVFSLKAATNKTNVAENVKVAGTTKAYTADYKGTGNKIVYGIKFKGQGDELKSAYRYELVGTGNNAHLKVTVRYIGKTATDINTVASEAYWNANKQGDVEKTFPLGGFKAGEQTLQLNENGHYLSSDLVTGSSIRTYRVVFGSYNNLGDAGTDKGLLVRLFSDK